MNHFEHLGPYSDWVDEARRHGPVFPLAAPGADSQARVREVLGFTAGEDQVPEVTVEATWEADGLSGQALTWSLGYGPPTRAWLLRPRDARGPLPGVVALHDHGGFKYFGKEKIALGPDPQPDILREYQRDYYGGRPFANALAQQGFAVLIHDAFLWGSRRFPVDVMRAGLGEDGRGPSSADQSLLTTINDYNALANLHEHVVAKYANLLGTSMAGVVSHEDRVALNVLRTQTGVDPDLLGCIGLSGGGNRAAMLQATHDHVRAAVIVGLMSTYAGLLDQHVWTHTWMLYPYGWARYGDWPDLAACRAPSPILVQYDLDDALFSQAGMHAAHERLQSHYAGVGAPAAYRGEFYPGPHKFDLDMQQSAFDWLKAKL